MALMSSSGEISKKQPILLVNSNVRADNYSKTVTGYENYIFIYATGHNGGHSVTATNATVVNSVALTTSDFDDGTYRDLGHYAWIKSNNKNASVTISAKVGSNYYGASKVVIVGF